MKTTMICWSSFAIHTGTVAVLCPRNEKMQMLKLACFPGASRELQRGKGDCPMAKDLWQLPAFSGLFL